MLGYLVANWTHLKQVISSDLRALLNGVHYYNYDKFCFLYNVYYCSKCIIMTILLELNLVLYY